MYFAFQLLLILFFPAFSLWYQKRSKISKWLSAIVLCYLAGMALSNLTNVPIYMELAKNSTEGSIAIAIPLLLFTTRLKEVFLHARSALFSFGLCIIAGLFSCIIATWLYNSSIEDAWKIGGMLVGIYTGGTPNMQAIGLALGASQESIILLNAADILTGGVYLILLTSFLPALIAKVLPAFDESAHALDTGTPKHDFYTDATASSNLVKWKEWGAALLLAIAVLGTSLGLTYLLYGNLNQTAFVMLSLTTLSIFASFLPFVKKWKHTYEAGEYFLLIFCVALGLQADLREILTDGGTIILFTALAMYGTILIHLLLARLFKIDRDTFLISSTAALYGPAFIGQMASVLKNRNLIFPGIALGLLGYAVGNYLGIGLASLLRLL